MINGLRSEFYKLFHARIFWMLLLICAGFSLFVTGLLFLEEKGMLIESITIEANEEVANNPLKGFYVLLESLVAPNPFFTYLFAALLGAFFLAGEYSNGTIKNVVSTGYKRHVFYITKTIVIWLGTIIIFTFMNVIFSVLTSLLFGVGTMPSSAEWVNALKIFGLTCMLIGGFSAISAFLSINATSTSIALFAGIGFYLIFVTGLDMLAYQYTFFEKMMPYSIFDYMARLPLDLGSTNNFISSLLGVTLGTIILFTSGGIALFQRKDIN